MSANTESTQLHKASWVMILVGGIIVIASQGLSIWSYFMFFQILPMMPPEFVPLMLLSMQMMLMFIVVAITLGTLLLIAAVVAYWKSPLVGGILAIIFSVGLFAISGFIAWVGAILAIIGGILGIVSSRGQSKSPEPEII
ncbi:MAG: hypothetical protein ACFFD8_07220 [Candidatus Thorarchaeota archaeon]